MKSIYYQILTVLSEFYPGWAIYLNKRREHKNLADYRRIISEDWPPQIIQKLADWLNSSNNIHHRKSIPTAIQLRDIVDNLLRKEVPIQSKKKSALYDPDLSVHRLAALWASHHREIFNEKNQHLKSSVLKIVACLTVNRPLYWAATYFVEIFCLLRKTENASSVLKKMLHPRNRKILLSKIGKVDINVLMKFLWETGWHSEISEILDKKYKKPLE